MNIFNRQTREEHLKEIATGINGKLLNGDYTPTEILFINEMIKYNSGEYLNRELRKNAISDHKLKQKAAELKQVLDKLNA